MRTWHLLLALCAALQGCVGVRTLADPTLEIQTSGGRELGVATDYGVVFLGRTAHGGNAQITAWYGDGPSLEKTVIEPVGNGLFTAETEIRLPSVSMDFEDPRPGQRLLVFGRDRKGAWKSEVVVAQDPRVVGIITTIPERLRGASEQVGAGVYSIPAEGEEGRRLVGLAAGIVRIGEGDGAREYLAVVGPTDLWRIVAHRRDLARKKRWVYREDIL
jgi:hypothetical protein